MRGSFPNSMPMLMVRRDVGGGTLVFNFMFSLDPIFNGEYGYPDLFQTGETAHGNKLVDYQHPHDLFSEVTATYRHPIGKGVEAFVYGGPVGEPALGGPMFLHRPKRHGDSRGSHQPSLVRQHTHLFGGRYVRRQHKPVAGGWLSIQRP